MGTAIENRKVDLNIECREIGLDKAVPGFQFLIREERNGRVFHEFDTTSKEEFLQHLDKLIGPDTTFAEIVIQNVNENHKHDPHGSFGPDD